MTWTVGFFINSILFGMGLAMDAFSVSLANGLREPKMKPGRMCLIAGVFGVFQTLMPLIGWFCVHNLAKAFTGFQPFIPWIALILLAYIGGKMLIEGIGECRSDRGLNAKGLEAAEDQSFGKVTDTANSNKGSDTILQSSQTSAKATLSLGMLLVQGIATAIDALSVGFTIADLGPAAAVAESAIIGIVTFVICFGGLSVGKKVGDRLSGKAGILGGVILVGIGIEIFFTNIF